MAVNPPGPAVATKPRVRWRWRGAGLEVLRPGRRWRPVRDPAVVSIYFYISFSRMIDARLRGEMQRADPRIFARPFELRRGQSLTPLQIIDRLNDLGYSHRAQGGAARRVHRGPRRGGDDPARRRSQGPARPYRVRRARRPRARSRRRSITSSSSRPRSERVDRLTLDAPLITALVTAAREKRRDVPLAAIPPHMMQAVLAIEDRRFYDHPGIDPDRHRQRALSTTSSAARSTCAAAAPSRSSSSRTRSSRRNRR